MAVCAQGLEILWIVVESIAVDVIDIQLAWVFGYKATHLTVVLLIQGAVPRPFVLGVSLATTFTRIALA